MIIGSWNIGDAVYQSSLLLLYPTLALLGLAFLRMMWLLGEVIQDMWTARRYGRADAVRRLRDIDRDADGSVLPSLAALAKDGRQHPQVQRFIRPLLEELERGPRCTLPARIEHLVGRVEAGLARDVNRTRVLVRLGPLLGLIGTLVPLGPGLMALSAGDLERLSAQLVVAFSTTVVGLLIGGVSYAIALARAHSAEVVLGDVQLVADVVCALLEAQAATTAGSLWQEEAEEVSA